MHLKEAEYVLAIERHRTIYRAAEELGITQPSLSRFLQGLEQELGVKLFERSGKRLVLTYAGKQYIQLAISFKLSIYTSPSYCHSIKNRR